jgi:hypothetical protein
MYQYKLYTYSAILAFLASMKIFISCIFVVKCAKFALFAIVIQNSVRNKMRIFNILNIALR